MWFEESNRYFYKIENFAYGEINEQNFSNPHPWFLGMYNQASATHLNIGHP